MKNLAPQVFNLFIVLEPRIEFLNQRDSHKA